VLEGAVRQDGNRVRVNVALVRTTDGMQYWAGSYAGTLDDIFLIQRRIGVEVADSLHHKLAHSPPVAGPLTTKGDIYSAYLSARKLARARESTKATQAIAILRDVVKRDPGYAPAWAELGKAMAIQMGVDPAGQRAMHQAEAVGHVRRALALTPDLAEAHTAMAIVMGIDLPEAEHHIRRAAQLDPNNPEVQLYLATADAVAGDFPKELADIRRAVELDPMFRAASGALTWVAPTFGQDELAQRQLARLERNASPDLWHLRGHFDWARHDYSQAISDFLKAQKVVTFPNRNHGDQHLGELLRELGFTDSALKVTHFDEGIWRLWQGEVPTIAALRARNRTCLPVPVCGGEGNDHDGYFGVLATKLLLNAGRGRELARLYDGEGLVGLSPSHLTDRPGILAENGPMLVLALRADGRAGEAKRLLAAIDGQSRAILARGAVPNWFYFDRAQTLELMGRRGDALAVLEQALDRGWIYAGEMTLPDIGDEPALSTMRGNPRFERIRARIAAHIARERAEVAKLTI
jgi:tetratricopeptide (TPR) repeat protein